MPGKQCCPRRSVWPNCSMAASSTKGATRSADSASRTCAMNCVPGTANTKATISVRDEGEAVPMISASEALERLREGNRRFMSDDCSGAQHSGKNRRRELAEGQEPFATILGCSDSRVPAEIIFDQGLGDLFVIRVAGNIIAPSLVG